MCPIGRVAICWSTAWQGCHMLVHRGSANQRFPVLETHRIPLEHTGRTLLILARVISIEESVPETLLFGLPSCKLKLRTRLRFLPSAPFNARCDGFGRICHGSPPLLDRTSDDCAAPLPGGPLIWLSQGLYLPRFRNTLVKGKEDARGSRHRVLPSCFLAERQRAYMFQSVAVVRWLVIETMIGS